MRLLDLSHTSHTRAQTGIQRVCRALYRELGDEACAITWDPYAHHWRGLNVIEQQNLGARTPSSKRGAVWPWSTQLRGWSQRLLKRASVLPLSHGLIVPELFSATVAAVLPLIKISGPRIALFHDAIALKYPELSPPKTVARFPAYLQELAAFDGIAAVSEDSAATLRDYWRWLGRLPTPPIQVIPLGITERQPIVDISPTPKFRPRVLCVGTLEGRKNHLALLAACESLWGEGLDFELQLIGLARPDTAAAALAKVTALRAANRPIIYHGAATENELQAAYTSCTFTVYPSIYEGFGLPVIESLQHGKPCICSGYGALGESARGGGCLMLDKVDTPTLTEALRHLLTTPSAVATLQAEARQRTFRTWRDYSRDLTGWMDSL